MRCIVVIVFIINSLLKFCRTFNANVNRSLKYTALENIVNEGIRRLCDQQTNNVLEKSKRPLVSVSDFDGDFDLHTKVGRSVSKSLDISLDQANEKLSHEIKKELSTVASCQISHDTLRIKLRDDYILDQLDRMLEDDRLSVGKLTEENVLVDYFGPNVGKMLHMGHIRSLAIGQSISNLLEFSGSKVSRRNHVGDFGLQSGIIMRYLIEYDPVTMDALDESVCDRDRELETVRRFRGYSTWKFSDIIRRKKFDRPVPTFIHKLVLSTMDTYYKLACDLFSKDPDFNRRARAETNLLQNLKSFGQTQWDNIREVCLGHYQDLLEFYFIKGLKNIPESFYKNVAAKLVKGLVAKGKAKEVEKSVVFTLGEEKGSSTPTKVDESPEADSRSPAPDSLNKSVLVTSEGNFTYMATDLAALSHRISWNRPDRIIYVAEKNQKSHFEKLYKISKKLNMLNDCELEHLGFGQVTLEGSGKMRSRSGSSSRLVDVTNEVVDLVGEEIVKRGDYLSEMRPVLSRKLGVGALLFSDLSVEPSSGYNFSIDRVMKQGNNNLIAILYSYVRSLSLARKSEGLRKVEGKGFRNNFERRLALSLLGFENMVLAALASREPSRVCRYLLNLSKEFSQFYQNTPVIVDDAVHVQSLKIVRIFTRAVELALGILNIQPVKHL